MESQSPSSGADASPTSPESAGTTCLPPSRDEGLFCHICEPQKNTQDTLSPKYVEVASMQLQAPSKGSMQHPETCKPCAWFWHHKGCSRGVDCDFCHLCPRGELKARQARQKELKSTKSTCESKALQEVQNQETEKSSLQSLLSLLPSVGSAAHGTGECRPCAWFWKEGGCKNGQECRHCHLCPEGEIRQRKKLKQDEMKAKLRSQGDASSALHQQLLQMQLFHQWQAHMFAANMIQESLESLSLDGYPSQPP